jgi:hypothetical protein
MNLFFLASGTLAHGLFPGTLGPLQKARLSGRVSEIFRESFPGPVRGPGLDAFWLPVKGRRTQGPRTWCFAQAKQSFADDCLWRELVGARNRQKMGSENMGGRQRDLTQGCTPNALARESFNLSLWWIAWSSVVD